MKMTERTPLFYYAPMCHLSGLAYRYLLRQYHQGIRFVTYMFLAEAIIRNGPYREYLRRSFLPEDKKDVYIQLVFSSIRELEGAIEFVNQLPVCALNLNFACPAECASTGAYGEFFSREMIQQCCMAAVKASNKPVSVKVRLPEFSCDDQSFFTYFEGTGVKEVMCHARRGRKQNKKAAQDEVDFESLGRVKKAGFALIVNGGIKTTEEGLDLCRRYAFDGFMIGIELARNPRLIKLVSAKNYYEVLFAYLQLYYELQNYNYNPGQQYKELCRHCSMLGGGKLRNEDMKSLAYLMERVSSLLVKE